jgi:hypothetical protein
LIEQGLNRKLELYIRWQNKGSTQHWVLCKLGLTL